MSLAKPQLLTGMVLTSPAIKIDDAKLTFINVKISPIISNLFPKAWFPESVPLNFITRSEEGRKRYVSDPYIESGKVIRIRSGTEVMNLEY